jgi:zinc transporter ZupT
VSRSRRGPALILASLLSGAAVAGSIAAVVVFGASPIVLVLGAILAIAPWASIIDDQERPRRS